jgi:twitching motility two-component system response regulator PilH
MKTVLVVEDSRSEQRLIVSLLQQTGLKVALADSAESALSWLTENGKPDLIILDIIMPGISGLDLCRQIRSNPEFENIPIVFCSSKNQEFDQFWALRQGGNAYVTKPFSPTNLVQTVRKHLNE